MLRLIPILFFSMILSTPISVEQADRVRSLVYVYPPVEDVPVLREPSGFTTFILNVNVFLFLVLFLKIILGAR